MSKIIYKKIDKVCLEIGRFIEYWGFKEIEGRIWAHILLSSKPLCANDLIERTGVSKGLISISISRLLEYNVIKIDSIVGRRTQYFQVNEDVTDVIKEVLKGREYKLLNQIEIVVKELLGSKDELGDFLSTSRLEFLLSSVQLASKYLNIIIYGGGKITGFIFSRVPKINKMSS